MDENKQLEPAPRNWRRIIIETDGSFVKVPVAEVAGNIEMIGILQQVIKSLDKSPGEPLPPDQKDGAPKPATETPKK